MKILQIGSLRIEKKILLSLGLSISILIFAGLAVNFISSVFGLINPISEFPLLVSIDFIILVFIVIIFIKRRSEQYAQKPNNFNLKLDRSILPFFIPFFFPIMSIYGTYFMNLYENNLTLILMLISIIIYSVFIYLCHKNVNHHLYPVSLYFISLAMLLMTGLTSNYFIGWDVYTEYYAFSTVISNLQWDMQNFFNPTTATLSTSLLPAVYYTFIKINDVYIYKLIYNLLFATTPVAVYVIATRYLKPHIAFIVAFFFISQLGFLYTSQSAFRYSIAILLFSIAMTIYFEEDMKKSTQKALLIILMLSVVFSHYGVAYYYLGLFIFLWLAISIRKMLFKKDDQNILSINFLALFFITIFLWYSQLTDSIYKGTVHFGIESVKTISNFLFIESRTTPNQIVFGIGTQTISTKISVITHWITFIIITIGIFYIIWKYLHINDNKFRFEYVTVIILAWISLVASLLIPFISRGYDFSRIYLQSLILIAPAFYLGTAKLCDIFKRKKITNFIIILVIVLLFLSNTRIIPLTLNEPAGVHLDRSCPSADDLYVYDTDASGAEWLTRYSKSGVSIYSDDSSAYAFLISKNINIHSDFFNTENISPEGYIFLRHTNVVEGKIFTDYYHNVEPISDFQEIFNSSDVIFTSGSTVIYNNK